MAQPRHRSSAAPLAAAWAALILYASLYPFQGWRWPPGSLLADIMVLGWTRWSTGFDTWSNLLGYLPLGALMTIAARRTGSPPGSTLLRALLAAALLSYGTEVLQTFLPGRVPSMEDFSLNTSGAAAGALLALLGQVFGFFDRWHGLRERWFMADSAGALALLALWPVGLLFPTPLPLGLGQVGTRLREWTLAALADVPWASAVRTLLEVPAAPRPPLQALTEMAIVALGLLAPCLLAYAVMQPGWRRAVMALGAAALACATMTLSTLLNFGPPHALAWLAPAVWPALGAGCVLALLAVPVPARVVAGLGLVALTGLVFSVAQAPDDPYFAQSLKAWEQGRFVRFHGLAQWVGWLWPYAAAGYLLARLGRRPG